MRRYTKSREKLNREVSAERKAFLVEFPRCWFCDSMFEMSVHEIASGTHARAKAIQRRETWCAACTPCNCDDLTNKIEWPIEKQIAVKILRDPAYTPESVIRAVCECRGRAPTAIEWKDVAEYLTCA